MGYFSNIGNGVKTTVKGLSLTLKHLWAARETKGAMEIRDHAFFEVTEGNVTLKYPYEQLSVPDAGRYQLDCEIDDCIVCDKCAKICPVDCIEIEAIKSPELIRHASDGSPVRLHAAKFNIDMAKCCFCGLCTTVCPTECLTMTDEYDFSVQDVNLLNFAFSNLSEEEAQEKRELYTQFVAEKEAAKAVAKAPVSSANSPAPKPVFRPKPAVDVSPTVDTPEEKPVSSRPAFVPKAKPESGGESKPAFVPKAKPEVSGESKPAFVPKAKPEVSTENKPKFVPKAKPQVSGESKPAFVPKAKPQVSGESKPAFVPKAKPEVSTENKPAFVPKAKPEVSAESKPAFVPKAKPEVSAESKPAFVPKTKPRISDE